MLARVSFEPASGFPLKRLTQAFNHAFTGYYLPMTQTPSALAEMIRVNDVALSASRVMLLDGALAGIGLVGLRTDRAWIAGMGLDPRWRGHGYGRALLDELLDAARRAGARSAQLEALTINTPALALYESMGFRDMRELRVYQGALSPPSSRGAPGGHEKRGRLAPVSLSAALGAVASSRVIAPSWQREQASLHHMRRQITGIALWDGDRVIAYALYAHHESDLNLFDAQSVSPSPARQRDDVMELIAHLTAGQRGVVARAINVPVGSALGGALEWFGCPAVARQREMSRAL